MSAIVAAIIFAGGRGSRLGGADKADLDLGGHRLLDRVIAATQAAGVSRPVIVGPDRAGLNHCVVVREDPPFAGPLAALAAGLSAIEVESSERDAELLLLSCDLEHPDAVITQLLAQSPTAYEDAVVLRDPDGRAQWLAGRYRVASLSRAVAHLGDEIANQPLRRATERLTIGWRDAPSEIVADIDTPQDLARARAKAQSRASAQSQAHISDPGGRMSNHLPPEALDAWLAAAAAELGVDSEAVRIGTVLDVARDVAHDVARPAAPLSTFLLGVAYARSGAADPAQLEALAERLTARAVAWKTEHGGTE